MKKSLIALAALAAAGGTFAGRVYTKDVSYGFRMPGGIPGDINRSHPVSALPVLNDVTSPVLAFGAACVFSAAGNSVRNIAAGDQGASIIIAGTLARSYPTQQTTGNMTSTFGAASPGAGTQTLVRQGYVMCSLPNFAAANAVKGGTVYVWTAASTGNHVQGAFEATVSAGNTTPVTNARFNGPADSAGTVEIEFWSA